MKPPHFDCTLVADFSKRKTVPVLVVYTVMLVNVQLLVFQISSVGFSYLTTLKRNGTLRLTDELHLQLSSGNARQGPGCLSAI